ncbi:hypothetical protein VPNG_08171 [Cytospora leucostoma]|uniref:Uncharacterized protein n=1 Tax=Cytospora leucostoma TaxID=1230097 RepID=A0A423WID8_9PEZI|nr:hypothetical protein VPNG_08171 [Cytospora leucostoma]
MDFATLNYSSFSSNMGVGAKTPQYDLPQYQPPQYQPSQSVPPGPALDTDSLPDTLSWRNEVPTEGSQTSLPPIPSPCLFPHSQSASTTASSQLRYLRPFGGKGMNTLSSVPPAQSAVKDSLAKTGTGSDTAHVIVEECHNCDDATPVPAGAATPTNGPPQSQGLPRPPPAPSVLSADQSGGPLPELIVTVQDHEQRLDSLESGSIYNTALEEFADRHDVADLRVTELETRMDDFERRLNNDNASIASSYSCAIRKNDASFSEVSAADLAAFTRILEALQARVDSLEASSLPSYASPWEIEVVFLPFPLQGIWVDAQKFESRSLTKGRDGSSMLPYTASRATPEPQSLLSHDEWAGQASGWMLPRALMPGRMMEQRLRSRGLCKTVQIRGGDARSVHQAIGNAFQSFLRMMPHPVARYSDAADPRLDRFLGLHQPWVPLRKVRKDDALRFLAPAELLTPVLWNTTFLNDSVVMKTGDQHRLYITQPEAYLQHGQDISFHGLNTCWTWQKIREMDRVYPDSQSSDGSSGVLEADAFEECWQFNQKLDDTAFSRLSSVDPQHSHEKGVSISRTTVASSEQYFTAASNPDTSMASPVMARGETPSTQSGRKGSLPPHVWIESVQPFYPPKLASPTSSGRRMSSSPLPPNYQRHSSSRATGRPTPRGPGVSNTPAISKITKDQYRSSRSPSLRPYNTPRHSNISFTRSPSLTPSAHMQVYAAMMYMTPHSNAPPGGSPEQIRKSRSVQSNEDNDEAMQAMDDRSSSPDSFSGISDEEMTDNDSVDGSVYKDKPDTLDDLAEAAQDSPKPRGPEDIPRPGVEDDLEMTRALEDDDDYGNNVAHDFVIHEDSDREEEGPEAHNLF